MDVSAKFLARDLHAFLGLTSSTQQVGVKKKRLENIRSQGAHKLASIPLFCLFLFRYRKS